METLYHYCSAEILRAILSNKTLRLSDVRKSNDSKEIEFLFNEYCKWIGRDSEDSEAARHNADVMRIDVRTQLKNTVFLTCCLSKNKDDFHMWKCYGDGEVCIGFDRDKLESYLQEHIRIGMNHMMPDYLIDTLALKLRDVDYFDESSIGAYFSSKGLNGWDDFIQLYRESPFVKSSFFQNENEVRIVYIYYKDPNLPNHLSFTDANGRLEKEIKFSSTFDKKHPNKMIIDIPIDSNLIESITIGPNCKLKESDIEEMAFIYGVPEIDIRRSYGINEPYFANDLLEWV